MAEIVEKYKNPDSWFLKPTESGLKFDSTIPQSGSLEQKEEVVVSEYIDYVGEVDKLSPQIFKYRNVVLHESWDLVLNIPSRIIHLNEMQVICESIVDSENKIFEERIFSMELFKHIQPLRIYMPVLIKVCTKPGSSRIDIYDGKGIVDSALFDLKDGWNDLKDSGLDKPFKI